MSAKTSIEWTDRSWNPVRGCQLESPGCTNCYAMKQAHRFSGPGKAYEGLTKIGGRGPIWTGVIRLVESALTEPLTWREPQRVFVNSMSDLFHEDVPDDFIDKVFAVMMACGILEDRHHTFQILTKRAERMRNYLTARTPTELIQAWAEAGNRLVTLADEDTVFSELVMSETAYDWDENGKNSSGSEYRPWGHLKNLWPLPNVWLGVSCENQEWADRRIPFLLQTPARVRFLSCEPLLGPIKFSRLHQYCPTHDFDSGFCSSPCPDLRFIDLCIVGGESGPGARPMHPDWPRSLRDQCAKAGASYFFKQWGDWIGGQFDRRKSKMICQATEQGKDFGRIFWTNPGQPKVHLWDESDHYWTNASAKVGKKAAGRLLDGRTWDQMPEVV